MRRFGLPVDSKARLRLYDPGMHVSLRPIDAAETTQISDISALTNYCCLNLEVAEAGSFEEYDPRSIHLKVCVYQPGTEYDFTEMNNLPYTAVQISND